MADDMTHEQAQGAAVDLICSVPTSGEARELAKAAHPMVRDRVNTLLDESENVARMMREEADQ